MCIHRLADGTPCSAPAVARSPRCRHHQLDLRRRERVAHVAAATRAYQRLVVAAHGRELLDMPFADAVRQLDKLRNLGFLTASHARSLRYGLQLIAQIKNQGTEVRGQGTGKSNVVCHSDLELVEREESALLLGDAPKTSVSFVPSVVKRLVVKRET